MWSLFFLALVAPLAHASTRVISIETTSQRFTNVGALGATCLPGVAPNGHNYPTASDLELRALYAVTPLANARSIGMMDPQMRLGNNCAELLNELASALPADLTVTRTISESKVFLLGQCVRTLNEELTGKIGPYTLEGGSGFTAERLPESECTTQ